MDAELLDRWIERADLAVAQGDNHRALETLRQVLAIDPDHAVAHARLSTVLFRMKRLHAALYEAETAVGLSPEHPATHAALGLALMGHRRFADARRELTTVIEMAPEGAQGYFLLSTLSSIEGRRHETLELLHQALERDPDDPAIVTALGDHWLGVGDLDAAGRAAQDALALDPGHVGALVLQGQVLLQRGDVGSAREHALWALSTEATDEGALALLAAVKARSSVWLGAWWRWNTWMQTLGQSRTVVVLLVAFVAYRLGTLVAIDVGYVEAALALQLVWLLLCLYSWTAPSMFARMLGKELKSVSLRSDF